MKTFALCTVFVALFWSGEAALFAQEGPPSSRKMWSANLMNRVQPLSAPEDWDFVPKPYLIYSQLDFRPTPQQIFLILGGPFNQITWNRQLAGKWDFSVKGMTLIYLGGDRPKVDKDRFLGQYDFRSHQIDLELGLHRNYWMNESAYRASLSYHGMWSRLFKRRSFDPPPPGQYWQHGPIFHWGRREGLRNRSTDFGLYPQWTVAYQSRENWKNRDGDIRGSLDRLQFGARRWWEAAVGLQWNHALSEDWSSQLEVSGQWVQKSDRLNSRLGKLLKGDFQQRFFYDLRADQFVEAQAGLIRSLTPQIFARAYGIGFHQRELTPFEKRRSTGGGAVAEIAGRSMQRLSWSFYTGALYGLQKDPEVTPELGFQLGYQL